MSVMLPTEANKWFQRQEINFLKTLSLEMTHVSINCLFEQAVCPPKNKEIRSLMSFGSLFEVRGLNFNLEHVRLHDWGSYRIIFALKSK